MKLCALTKMMLAQSRCSPDGTTPALGVRRLSLAVRAELPAKVALMLLAGRGSRHSACAFLYQEEKSSSLIHPRIQDDRFPRIMSI